MGRQWNQIIESLGPLTGGTVSINANLGDIDALLTTLQADVADGIKVNSIEGAYQSEAIQYFSGIDLAGFYSYLVQNDGNDVQPVSSTNPLFVKNTVSTSGGTGPTTFTSTTYGTIATANADRKGLTIYNEGSGNLHVTLGTATTSTSSYTVKIIPTAYYEVPYNYTGLIGGIFATAGTARVTQLT